MALSTINESLVSQFNASLKTLENCINSCTVEKWDQSHGDYPFSQVVFHALFYCDFYLSENEEAFKNQEFHENHKETFSDYEELEYRLPIHLYSKNFVKEYLEYCKEKINKVVKDVREIDLLNVREDSIKKMSKLELYIYTIRHIQHHAAQLGLRLQFLLKKEMEWVSRE